MPHASSRCDDFEWHNYTHLICCIRFSDCQYVFFARFFWQSFFSFCVIEFFVCTLRCVLRAHLTKQNKIKEHASFQFATVLRFFFRCTFFCVIPNGFIQMSTIEYAFSVWWNWIGYFVVVFVLFFFFFHLVVVCWRCLKLCLKCSKRRQPLCLRQTNRFISIFCCHYFRSQKPTETNITKCHISFHFVAKFLRAIFFVWMITFSVATFFFSPSFYDLVVSILCIRHGMQRKEYINSGLWHWWRTMR